MKQKKVRLAAILLLGLSATALHAQHSSNAAGDMATGSGGTASYSVGQVVYTQTAGSGGTATQGVQQPYEFYTTGIDEAPGISLLISAYPNPAQSVLNLSIGSTDHQNISYALYDMAGREVMSRQVTGALTEIAMQSMSTGTYMLRVSENEKTIKSFTIIKNK